MGCLLEICAYCGGNVAIGCQGLHMADIARERTPPDLAEYLSRPGTLAYLESLRAEPGMDPATMDMVIALAKVFAHPRLAAPRPKGMVTEGESNDPVFRRQSPAVYLLDADGQAGRGAGGALGL